MTEKQETPIDAHTLREIAKTSDAAIMEDVEKVLFHAKKAAEAGKYSIDIGKHGVDRGEIRSLLSVDERGWHANYANFEIKQRIVAMLVDLGFKVCDQQIKITVRLFPDDPDEPTSEDVYVWVFRVSWLQ